MNVLDIKFLNRKKEEKSLRDFGGEYYLIVNTASKCGLVGQFDGLEELNQKYKGNGLTIIGFPCGQFADQELASAEEASSFCRLNHGVTFPLMDKVDVNGEHAAPIFEKLKSEKKGLLGSAIKWNFTKFLVDSDGTVIKRFGPKEEPSVIDKYLAAEIN